MKKRVLVLCLLIPIGGLAAVGLFRMIQHDWSLGPKPAAAEAARPARPHEPDVKPEPKAQPPGPLSEMRRIYHANRDPSPPDDVLDRFAELAAGLDQEKVLGLIAELDVPAERATAASYLIVLHIRWLALDPVKAWERACRDAAEAKNDEDRGRIVERMTPMLAAWSQTDAHLAWAAFVELVRTTESLHDMPQWYPELHELFSKAGEAFGEDFPAKLRGLASRSFQSQALADWAESQVHAGADPPALQARLQTEGAAIVPDATQRAEFLQPAAERVFNAWLERDADAAIAWFAGNNEDLATIALLEKVAAMGGTTAQAVGNFLLSRPPEARDAWVVAFLNQTSGAYLELLQLLSTPELRWKCLKQAAWPKVAEKQADFTPWACPPDAVRRAMDQLNLGPELRVEIEQILSVR